jgi:pyruvate/2-oxoglutarate dehydrogenase complex dihydrolipoamide acyltransferase (E2) component
MEASMLDVKVPDDLWATSTLPEGVLERWLVPDGTTVRAGDPVAAIRLEEALHEVIAPAPGRLAIAAAKGAVIEPAASRQDPGDGPFVSKPCLAAAIARQEARR